MKKIVVMIMALSLMLSLCACSGSSTQKPISTDDGSQQTSTSGQPAAPQESDAPEETAVSIENAVLLEQDGLVITAKELVDDSIWGMGVKVLVENNSEKNLGVQCNSIIVNNYMITDLFSCSVAAGKKSNETIYLSSSGLEAAGITTISDIVISFHVFDSDSYSTLFDTEEIEIKTSAYGTVEQVVMDDGKELFNQDGIRIVGRFVEEDSFWGAGVLLFIENGYGENIIVQCDNMSINGFMVTPFFSCTVNNGRMALSDITIMSSDLEENEIETVEDIELVFKIINPDTYQTIVETEPIAFSAN
ncbi:MAG: hypothetical protein ACOX85_09585 [Candidatus Pararuminococcus gallinarum]